MIPVKAPCSQWIYNLMKYVIYGWRFNSFLGKIKLFQLC
jgi:hypothetical protein